MALLDTSATAAPDSRGEPPLVHAPERERRRRRLRQRGLSARPTVRETEPYLLSLMLASAVGLITVGRVSLNPVSVGCVFLLLAVDLLAVFEFRRREHRREIMLRLLRGAVVVLVAPQFGFDSSSAGWPWIWLAGLAALYPCALPRWPALAFVVTLVGYEEIVTAHFFSSGGGFEIAQRVTIFLVLGYLSHVWGRTLDASARAHRGIRFRDQRAEVVAAYSDVVMAFTDRQYRVTHINREVERVLGYTVGQIKACWGIGLIHADDRALFLYERRELLARPNGSIISHIKVRHARGHWVSFEVRITNLVEHPAVRGFFASATDISQRVEAETQLHNEKTLLRTVVDYLPLSVYTKGIDGRYLMTNRANIVRLGLNAEHEIIGRQGKELSRDPRAAILDRDDQRVLEKGESIVDQQVRIQGADRNARWYQTTKLPIKDIAGKVTGLVGIARDITETKAFEAFLLHQASHDPLTGLYNRRYFTEQLAGLLASPVLGAKVQVLLFCDLDLFKTINDRYGHEVGDRFLQALGTVLQPFGRDDGRILARFGGDEFVLLAPLNTADEGLPLAADVLRAISEPVTLGHLVLQTDASIGVATLRAEHQRPEDLIRDADTAMYQAKAQGRNRIAFFDDALRERTTRHVGLLQSLRGAQDRSELSLVYQPKVDLRTGRVSGFEALMRWHSPEYGIVSPYEFIALAEESGLIVPLGIWALEHACRQLRAWQEHYPALDHLTIAVNVSMHQLLHDGFLAEMVKIIEISQIYPAALELELTESAAMQNPAQSVALLRQLKGLGLRLALDDFGTGYSSLAHLRRLPIDVLKIDRTFVQRLERERDDTEIVRLVIALARTLGIECVAEGIESRANASEIKRLGCDLGQGYYFSRALPAPEAAALLDLNPNYFVD